MTIDKKSLINWVGGKRLLRKTIEPLIPTDIKSYIEPFGGGGWILFYKQRWADLKIYNDLDFINMITTKDANISRILICYMKDILINCICCSTVPVITNPHLSRTQINILI